MSEPDATHAVLSIGANLGDPLAALRGAVNGLCASPGVTVRAVSSVYETDPVGGPEQPTFLNAIVIIETSLSGGELLARVHEVEAEWHRTREVRWGPRTLDIDIIDFGGQRADHPDLTLPHPRAQDRGFVIVPWREVEPEASLPGLGPIADLRVDTTGVRATGTRLFIQ